MTDVEKLKKCIDDSGMTMVAIAEKTGISRETIYNRMKTGDFKLSEICALSRTLRMSKEKRDEIFFENESELYSHI